jgi:CSLREA domain-containing protein
VAVDKIMWPERARTLAFGLAVMAALLFGLLQVARPAHAATFTVNSTGDGADANTADNICDSDLGTADEQCTLRAAIQQANATSGADQINFSIPGTGVHISHRAPICPRSPKP